MCLFQFVVKLNLVYFSFTIVLILSLPPRYARGTLHLGLSLNCVLGISVQQALAFFFKAGRVVPHLVTKDAS